MGKPSTLAVVSWGFLALITINCATPARTTQQPQAQRAQFVAEEYAKYDQPGNATIRGQGFLRQRGGTVVTAAGSSVYLNPSTSYSAEWYTCALAGVALQPPDERAAKYVRQAQADAEGRFTFRDLPAGEYFVLTSVSWDAPVGYKGGMVTQGGVVGSLVVVGEGESKDVILTR